MINKFASDRDGKRPLLNKSDGPYLYCKYVCVCVYACMRVSTTL
jgi:hypothetical protein